MTPPATTTLAAYLALEAEMITADARGDSAASDALRDRMDPLWYALTDDEQAALNDREG